MSTSPPTASTTPTAIPISGDPPPSAPPPVRKFPAPCWTQEETLALITAYQDKWYSLRRRNLRTADWEAVAADVTRRCPDQSPPKTSAQCRHKMEKLRKRYRTEKQRILSLPAPPPSYAGGRFFAHHPPSSNWVFFDLMDAMEAGSTPNNPNLTPNPSPNSQDYFPSGIPIRMVNDNGKPSLALAKVELGEKSGNLKTKEEFGKYFDEILMGVGGGGGNGSGGGGPIKFRVKNNSNTNQQHHTVNRFNDSNRNDDEDDDDDYYEGNGVGGGNDYMKGGRNSMPGPPPGFKRKYSSQDYDDRYDEGYPSSSRKVSNGGMKNGSGSGSRRDSVAEMVSSIKMLGEGLVRMEKMKMDMMREIEKMRMEMEMKRSEMILESQQLIVNAFVEGLKKNKKAKVMEVE